LLEKFELLTKQFKDFVSKYEENQPLVNQKDKKGKGPKKGKNTQKKTLQEEINFEADKRLRQFLAQQSEFNESRSSQSEPVPGPSRQKAQTSNSRYKQFTSNSSRQSETWTEDQDGDPDPPKPLTKNVFIRRIDCYLNANPIDQIEDKQTEDECMQAYFRLFTHNGQMNSLYTNSISYNEFSYVNFNINNVVIKHIFH